MPTSDSYHDYLIARLKDPSYAALYLETHFELEEGESPQPELLRLALSHVAEALSSPEQLKINQDKLDELLSQKGSDVIYNLGTWLQLLGLKLTVAVPDDTKEIIENSPATSEVLV
ncbi:MAG TPA: transcriptional regulator [Cyanobacteria bacterium UBA11149]|nr:transcriptional regulator [Cyanobacteria bacterium UBA11366]HBK62240.1 transcriptional regulator [Cyanobacteria bacterium UBA11166]HBR74328.1 transcriptional regulator [Cyanobacteria bacterium UBA11159]HBS68511.1 transcriptional regulator [Cyanobacteria bacterium UBA11153]HBW92465.1 transcriptional regulator [Cyanobacteria bacterium UBA11149]